MGENLPKISVITIVLNARGTIQTCIESIRTQKYPNLEYIVVDGGSTDGTLEVLESYRDQISVFMSEKDKGIADAFNKGVRVATGDLVGFMNSDDRYLPDGLRLLAQHWSSSSSQADIVFGSVQVVKDGRPRYIVKALKPSATRLMEPFVCHQAMLVRRELFARVGNFDTSLRFGMDFDWILRALKEGASISPLEGVTVAEYSFGGYSANNSWNALREFRAIALRRAVTRRSYTRIFYSWKMSKYWIQELLFKIGMESLVFNLKSRVKRSYRPLPEASDADRRTPGKP